MQIETLGDERVEVTAQGDDVINVAVDDPFFGRIATVRLTPGQAATLIEALCATTWRRRSAS